MGQIIYNGRNYSGLIQPNGVFIDTDNVVVSTTTFGVGGATYTATQDCVVVYQLMANSGGCNVQINGIIIEGHRDLQTGYEVISDYVYLKKGQTITFTPTHSDGGNYTVYGIQSGSNIATSINYSTNEQVIGTWIDGSTLYQKTWDLGSDVTVGSWTSVVDVTAYNIDVLVNSISVQNSKAISQIEYWIDGTILKGNSLRNNNQVDYVRYLTLQYTKTS